jgi:hypothetical protein
MSTIERLNSSRLLLTKSEFLDALSNADNFPGFLSLTSSSLYFLGSPVKNKILFRLIHRQTSKPKGQAYLNLFL